MIVKMTANEMQINILFPLRLNGLCLAVESRVHISFYLRLVLKTEFNAESWWVAYAPPQGITNVSISGTSLRFFRLTQSIYSK